MEESAIAIPDCIPALDSRDSTARIVRIAYPRLLYPVSFVSQSRHKRCKPQVDTILSKQVLGWSDSWFTKWPQALFQRSVTHPLSHKLINVLGTKTGTCGNLRQTQSLINLDHIFPCTSLVTWDVGLEGSILSSRFVPQRLLFTFPPDISHWVSTQHAIICVYLNFLSSL